MMRLMLLAVAGLTFLPGLAMASEWLVDTAQSRVGFEGSQQGSSFTGVFERYETDIFFDPDDLSTARVRAEIEIESINSGSSDRDVTVLMPAWFDANTHPIAVFESESFSATGENAYEAAGSLTMKGITKPVTLPFTLVIEGDTATMSGGLTIDRTEFEVGTGEWAGDGIVGREVTIEIDLTATRASP